MKRILKLLKHAVSYDLIYDMRNIEDDVVQLKEKLDEFRYAVTTSFKKALMTAYDVPHTTDAMFELEKLADDIYQLSRYVPGGYRSLIDDLYDLVRTALYGLEEPRYDIVGETEYKGRKIAKAKPVIRKKYVEELRKIINEITKKIKRKCGFSIPYKDKVTIPEVLNDVSNCVHVVAEEILKEVGEKEIIEVSDRLVFAGKPDPDLVELAVVWDKAVDFFADKGIYDPMDFEELSGFVEGKRAWFRVGSSIGHATHIEKSDNELRVEYYDTDDFVNDTMAKLFKDAGCSCEVKHNTGVTCSCPVNAKREIGIIMSLATSMDYRGGVYEEEKARFNEALKYIEEISDKIDKIVEEVTRG